MRAEPIADLAEFLDVTASWRAANPLTTNIISTIALNALSGARFVERIDGWVVRDDDGVVTGGGLAAHPYEFNVGPMSPDAAYTLGAAMIGTDMPLDEARGPGDAVVAFADGVRDASHGARQYHAGAASEGLYELVELRMPEVDGRARRVGEADLALVTQWVVDFAKDAGVVSHEPEQRARTYIQRGGMLLWMVDDRPVAMSGQAPVVDVGATRVGRIGPVFTPPEFRRRGYGAAVTAAATRDLLDAGARAMLFTDLANPTSNAIYQRLGYELVDTIKHVEFSYSST